jgi:hypothetical protein
LQAGVLNPVMQGKIGRVFPSSREWSNHGDPGI